MSTKTYLLFDATRSGFDDYEGGEVPLGQHLQLVDDLGVTPDLFDEIEAENPTRARLKAIETGLHLYVVDAETLRTMGVVNDPNREKKVEYSSGPSM